MRIVLVGEGMLELTAAGDLWHLGHGGDTLNTAIHLARYGHDVAFATALGDDPFSSDLERAWAAEGIDTGLVLTDVARGAGLYAIALDAQGERSFAYWRSDSAARRLFALPGQDRLLEAFRDTPVLCFSLISLAILPVEGRRALLDAAAAVRARGGIVAFDGNYRARLWEGPAAAREWRDEAIACSTIGLPTLEDETAMAGDDAGYNGGVVDAGSVVAHWRGCGAPEVAVKLGADGCLLGDGPLVPPARRLDPVDTSGAGDGFNAGYLHGRLTGLDPVAAARSGHRLAGWVIGRRGAVPPRDAAAPYADASAPDTARRLAEQGGETTW